MRAVAAFPTVDWDAASRVLDPKSVSGDRRRLAPSEVIVLATLVLVARTRGGA